MQNTKTLSTEKKTYKIFQTLGQGGSCKVKLGQAPTGEFVAIKILRDNSLAMIKQVWTEVEAMNSLNHLNVLKQIEYGVGKYKQKQVNFIVLEAAQGGELFDYIAESGRFDEPTARYFFKQFMEGLAYCHSQDITHRDLKPENLLLDAKYNLKIADFGFAAPVSGKDGTGELSTTLGTRSYMAPEIHLRQSYLGPQVDLFAAGIILFIMVAAHPPFNQAVPTDLHYKAMAMKKFEPFWKSHSQGKSPDFFSKPLQDLLNKMWSLNPEERPNMQEVMAHEWLQGETPKHEKVLEEFAKRNLVVQEKTLKKKLKMKKKAYRSGSREEESSEDDQEMELSKPIYQNMKWNKNTSFLTNLNADQAEHELICHLESIGIEPTVSDNKYKLKFEIEHDSIYNIGPLGFKIDITQVDEKQICISFIRTSGDLFEFKKRIGLFKEVLS